MCWLSLATASLNQPCGGHLWPSQSEGVETVQWLPEQWGSAHAVIGCQWDTLLCLSTGDIASWKTKLSSASVRSGTLRNFFSSLVLIVGNQSTNSLLSVCCALGPVCASQCVGSKAQVQSTVGVCSLRACLFERAATHRALLVPLLLGLLMKESNWIFWGWCGGVEERGRG